VVAQLAGRVLVAHNAPFDLRFIQAEFRRIGHQMPQSNTVDTYRLTGCKLEVACERFGITNDLAHSALGDAHATARVLRAVVDHHYEGVVPDGWLGAAAGANPAVWPVIEPPRDARPPLSRVPRA
jgi:DNA polymerase III subunit epsilon